MNVGISSLQWVTHLHSLHKRSAYLLYFLYDRPINTDPIFHKQVFHSQIYIGTNRAVIFFIYKLICTSKFILTSRQMISKSAIQIMSFHHHWDALFIQTLHSRPSNVSHSPDPILQILLRLAAFTVRQQHYLFTIFLYKEIK